MVRLHIISPVEELKSAVLFVAGLLLIYWPWHSYCHNSMHVCALDLHYIA